MGGLRCSEEGCLERGEAQAAHGLDECFALLALGHCRRRQCARSHPAPLRLSGWAEDFADGRRLGGVAAERDLVAFLAALLEAENADMAHMVMAAGIDAAGNLDVQLADVTLALLIREFLRNALRDRDRAGLSPARSNQGRGRR